MILTKNISTLANFQLFSSLAVCIDGQIGHKEPVQTRTNCRGPWNLPHKFHLYLILIISFDLFDKLIKTCFYLPFYPFKILANNEEDKVIKFLNGYSLTSPVLVCTKAKEQKVNITNSKMEVTLNFNSNNTTSKQVSKRIVNISTPYMRVSNPNESTFNYF